MDKRAGPVAEISLERGEISLTGMGISPYKHSQAGWPGCRDESSKIPPQAIFNNCHSKHASLVAKVKSAFTNKHIKS